jgi:hypothetical protein
MTSDPDLEGAFSCLPPQRRLGESLPSRTRFHPGNVAPLVELLAERGITGPEAIRDAVDGLMEVDARTHVHEYRDRRRRQAVDAVAGTRLSHLDGDVVAESHDRFRERGIPTFVVFVATEPHQVRLTVEGSLEACRSLFTDDRVLFVPFHSHLHETLMGVLASLQLPLTVLAGPDWADADDVERSTGMEIVPVSSRSAVLRLVRSMRKGRKGVVFGDLDFGTFASTGPSDVVEMFSAPIRAPSGPATVSRLAGARIQPCALLPEAHAPEQHALLPRFRLVLADPIDPPGSSADDVEATRRLWLAHEGMLRGAEAEWMGWTLGAWCRSDA